MLRFGNSSAAYRSGRRLSRVCRNQSAVTKPRVPKRHRTYASLRGRLALASRTKQSEQGCPVKLSSEDQAERVGSRLHKLKNNRSSTRCDYAAKSLCNADRSKPTKSNNTNRHEQKLLGLVSKLTSCRRTQMQNVGFCFFSAEGGNTDASSKGSRGHSGAQALSSWTDPFPPSAMGLDGSSRETLERACQSSEGLVQGFSGRGKEGFAGEEGRDDGGLIAALCSGQHMVGLPLTWALEKLLSAKVCGTFQIHLFSTCMQQGCKYHRCSESAPQTPFAHRSSKFRGLSCLRHGCT